MLGRCWQFPSSLSVTLICIYLAILTISPMCHQHHHHPLQYSHLHDHLRHVVQVPERLLHLNDRPAVVVDLGQVDLQIQSNKSLKML